MVSRNNGIVAQVSALRIPVAIFIHLISITIFLKNSQACLFATSLKYFSAPSDMDKQQKRANQDIRRPGRMDSSMHFAKLQPDRELH
jgi:hypothetical protein